MQHTSINNYFTILNKIDLTKLKNNDHNDTTIPSLRFVGREEKLLPNENESTSIIHNQFKS